MALLDQTDGFLGNPKVRIPLSGYLEDTSKLLKNFGQGERIDELVTSINPAVEAAVPTGKDLLVGAVRAMNVNDAKNIFAGGNTAATHFFCRKNPCSLGPVVFACGDQIH